MTEYLLGLILFSVVLQMYVYFTLKNKLPNLYKDVFDGSFAKSEINHTKKVFFFYYNPLNLIKTFPKINIVSLKLVLALNCILFYFIVGIVLTS
ncbi:hypothetical protein SAMN05660429_01929 [Thalassotalea agarivorans]|uniref:Uncharacterized protein n=1 Tax=Thalassotalea agarivorans TaxID=349064 RepID=A0A1I0EVG4_THASX|nr:hypothetical protein SAMN05660429_01929 [Thalassotalea agarivorans]